MLNETNPSSDWLIIANGTPHSRNKLRVLAQGKQVMVLDGAYQYAKKMDLKIDVLLGDFDSISASDLQQVCHTITVVHSPDQTKTDLEKGLNYIDRRKGTRIVICAGVGKRLSHTLFNLRLLKKYYRVDRPIVLLSNTDTIRYYQDSEITLSGQINDAIAILGFPLAKITTMGLKYDVIDYALQFENGISISNALALQHATIKICGDALVIHEKIK